MIFNYVYDNQKDCSSYDGDLENNLIEYGVSEEIIERAKNTILQPHPRYLLDVKSDPQIILVPTNKIIGTGRATPGRSVFDTVREIRSEDNLSPGRFEAFFMKNGSNLNINEFRRVFSDLNEPVKMEYYEDEDKYFLSGDGNHRTLLAMLYGADTIKSKVYRYKIDYEKLNKRNTLESIYHKYNISDIYSYSNYKGGLHREYVLEFSNDTHPYTISGFTDCFEENGKKKPFEEVLDLLCRRLDQDCEIQSKYQNMPSFLKKLFLYVNKKNRYYELIMHRYKREYLDNKIDLMQWD